MRAAPDPTPVASGRSPVTEGDLAYVLAKVPMLPRWRVQALARGSSYGPNSCNVCESLRLLPERDTPAEREVAADLLLWHGNDAIRCGVLYATAAALSEERPDA